MCVRSTVNTSILSYRLLRPDEGVWWAAFTHTSAIDHVVARRAGNTSRVCLRRPQGTVATLGGYTIEHIDDVDGVDLGNVGSVLFVLEKKENISYH